MAALLAGLWPVRHTPWFHRFIEVSCRTHVPELPTLRAVVISEAQTGNVQHGWVQSIATRHWVSDAAGFRPVPEPEVPSWARDTNAAADTGRRYSGWAKFHFFADGDRVAVRGLFGPKVRCWMVGRVTLVGGVPAFTEVRVPVSAVADRIGPGCPVCAELELPAQRHAEPAAAPDPAT
jgi:hypothetical protein